MPFEFAETGESFADSYVMMNMVEHLVDRIGSEQFFPKLSSVCRDMYNADFVAIYRQENGKLTSLVADGTSSILPRLDQARFEMRRSLNRLEGVETLVCISGIDCNIGSDSKRHQRIITCKSHRDAAYCLIIVRASDKEELSPVQIANVGEHGALIMSLIVKHFDIFQKRSNLTVALSSLQAIQACFETLTVLSGREVEVCARIIYGLSSGGIALDLGIGKESVMTYRKRAYRRLEIGSQRELLMVYLDLWSAQPDLLTKAVAV